LAPCQEQKSEFLHVSAIVSLGVFILAASSLLSDTPQARNEFKPNGVIIGKRFSFFLVAHGPRTLSADSW
jgi:O-antigen/teichoic acid export membrane protein